MVKYNPGTIYECIKPCWEWESRGGQHIRRNFEPGDKIIVIDHSNSFYVHVSFWGGELLMLDNYLEEYWKIMAEPETVTAARPMHDTP